MKLRERRLIAIVDDDDAVRRALKRAVVAANMNAVTFPSGRTFLDSLATDTPDCVVLDLHMPGLTGEDVLKALSHTIGLPVVAITGQGHPGSKASVLSLGAQAFLPKPVPPAELKATIDEAIANWRPRPNSAGASYSANERRA